MTLKSFLEALAIIPFETVSALSDLMGWGFTDVYRTHKPDEKEFTFWDYRVQIG